MSSSQLKKIIALVFLVLISSCGGQSTNQVQGNSELKAVLLTTQIAASLALSKDVSLMDSLAALYPNGKRSAQQSAASVKYLAQNPAALKLTSPAPQEVYKPDFEDENTFKSSATFADYQPVARIQNTTLEGSYFFSIYDVEIENALNTNPDWILEGAAFWASLATGDGLSPVHRFRNLQNGSYLYTIYEAEKAAIISNYSRTFTYEGVSWYARQTQASGWKPLYRFRNLINGTYLFTAYEEEKNQIQWWYDDVFALEGVAYYVRMGELPASPVVTAIAPLAATVSIPTVFVVEGANLPLDAELSFANASCSAPTQRTTTGFSQICVPAGSAGVTNVSVKASNTIGSPPTFGAKQITLLAQTVEPSYTGSLPDTGITNMQCYGAGSDVLISCTSAAAIALNPKQDGMIGRDVTAPAAADGKLGFSYSDVTKAAGGVYAKTECIKDNISGLTWEGKTASGLRSAIQTYTNYDSTTKTQKWDGSNQVNPTQTEIGAITNTVGYKNYVNSIALCGYTDWRLPSVSELDGLVDVVPNAYGHLDVTWFPNSWGTGYWSSTDNGNTNAWFMDMYSAASATYPRHIDIAVRLVRGGGAVAVSRYTYINNGTEVLDSKTKLIWKRCAEGMAWNGNACVGIAHRLTHEQAMVKAATQIGWRLPNRKELFSLYDIEQSVSLNAIAFPPTNYEYDSFVSTTPDTDYSYQVWGVTYKSYRSSDAWSARLVRNSP
jgi:Protein of unknown function (DUF1566)/Repeat of unknown function (DUF5648)